MRRRLVVVAVMLGLLSPLLVQGEAPVCDSFRSCAGMGCDSATCLTPRMFNVTVNREIEVSVTSSTASSTVVQGAAGTCAAGWWSRICDGTDTLNITAAGEAPVAQGQAAPSGSPWPVRLEDGTVNAVLQNTSVLGNEVGLVVRNIPGGVQPVSGTVTANAGTARNVATYSAAATYVPVAGGTDTWTLTGSASKTLTVLRIACEGVSAAAFTSAGLSLLKRSAANTGGTSAAATAVPMDSADGAATGTVLSYTANPAGLGALIGVIETHRPAYPTAAAPAYAQVPSPFLFPSEGRSPVLRGVAEVLSLNLNGSATVPSSLSCTVVWTEE